MGNGGSTRKRGEIRVERCDGYGELLTYRDFKDKWADGTLRTQESRTADIVHATGCRAGAVRAKHERDGKVLVAGAAWALINK